MDTKTYKADTMLEALQMVQNELGADAVVLSAREVPAGPAWGKWKRTAVEVIAMPSQAYQKKQPAAPQKAAMPLVDNDSEINWVKENDLHPSAKAGPTEKKPRSWQPAHITREEAQTPVRPAAQPEKPQANNPQPQPGIKADVTQPTASPILPSGLNKNRQVLLAQGVEEAYLDRTMKLLTSTMNPAALLDENNTRKYLFQILEAELRIVSGIDRTPPARLMILVGPSGSGKTSITAKTAVHYAQHGKKITWVCADTVRTGAIYQGRAYAEALGLPFKLAYTPEDLRDAVLNDSESDLILVDTPGYNPLDEHQMIELGSFLTELPNRQTFLTLSATAKETDSFQAAATLGIFGLDGIMVTKLDETSTFGSIYNFVRKSRLPMGFFSSGKDATNQFQLANTTRLVAALFGKGWIK
jgi:flagellar biosynthesis protein FlhF